MKFFSVLTSEFKKQKEHFSICFIVLKYSEKKKNELKVALRFKMRLSGLLYNLF